MAWRPWYVSSSVFLGPVLQNAVRKPWTDAMCNVQRAPVLPQQTWRHGLSSCTCQHPCMVISSPCNPYSLNPNPMRAGVCRTQAPSWRARCRARGATATRWYTATRRTSCASPARTRRSTPSCARALLALPRAAWPLTPQKYSCCVLHARFQAAGRRPPSRWALARLCCASGIRARAASQSAPQDQVVDCFM